jgi:BolA family transcriptional regulator, general stress-responsive regulator
MSRFAPSTQEIEARIHAAIAVQSLVVQDDSAKHHGHEGAASGGGHFHVTLVSTAFEGKNRLARHRLVYDCLSDWIPARIHALSIDARTPSESS